MKNYFMKVSREEGFTLIETTIVLLVIALLSILILPNITKVSDNVTSSTNKAIVATVEAQMKLYRSNNNNEPVTAETLFNEKYITQEQWDAYKEAEKDE